MIRPLSAAFSQIVLKTVSLENRYKRNTAVTNVWVWKCFYRRFTEGFVFQTISVLSSTAMK